MRASRRAGTREDARGPESHDTVTETHDALTRAGRVAREGTRCCGWRQRSMCCRVVRRLSRRPIGHTAPEAGASPRSAAMMMTRHRDGPGRPTRRRARSSLMNSAEEGGSRCTDRRRRSRWPLFVGRADDRRTPRVEPALARARERAGSTQAGRHQGGGLTHTHPGRRGTLAHRAVRKLGEVTALGVKEQSRRHRQEHRIPRVARTHDVPGHMARERGIVREKPRCDSRDHGMLASLLAAHRERSQQRWGAQQSHSDNELIPPVRKY